VHVPSEKVHARSRTLITGGASFLGSHLCARLIAEGWGVLCVDSLLTGRKGNLDQRLIEWEPVVTLEDGLARTVEWARASWT
jgi:UDP-glucuronate decarboxylase